MDKLNISKQYEVRLALTGHGYISLFRGDWDMCHFMLEWYEHHKAFFNGIFSVVEVNPI